MRTSFPKFCNYLKIFFLVIFLTICTLDLNAQTSFDLRIDGFANGNPANTIGNKMVPCVDGGYIMSGTVNSEDYFVIKTDSVGNVEWSNKLVQGNQLDPADIIATNDSGFYFMNNQLDGQFGTYNFPVISKVDKYGSIQKSSNISTSPGGIYGIDLEFCEVDSNNNDLLIMGSYYIYNGSNGPCCNIYFILKLDSSLNVIFSTRLDNLVAGSLRRINVKCKKVYVNNQNFGYLVTGLRYDYSSNSLVYFLDSIGNLVWTRKYYDLEIRDFVQNGNNIFFISSKSLSWSTYNSKIFKSDLSGNIISSKEFQVSGSILLDGIAVNSNSELLISGNYFNQSPVIRSNLLLLSDTAFNVMIAKDGVNPTLIFYTKKLPLGNLNSIVLVNNQDVGLIYNAVFEKINIANPLCNYLNLSITMVSTAILDSSLSFANLPFAINDYNYNQAFIPEYFNYSSPCLTSGNEDLYDDSNLDLNVNPNPAKDYIELSINGTVSSSEVTIFNITGEAIFKIEMNGTNKKIPIADLSQGIYFVNVITEKKKLNAKFIKL